MMLFMTEYTLNILHQRYEHESCMFRVVCPVLWNSFSFRWSPSSSPFFSFSFLFSPSPFFLLLLLLFFFFLFFSSSSSFSPSSYSSFSFFFFFFFSFFFFGGLYPFFHGLATVVLVLVSACLELKSLWINKCLHVKNFKHLFCEIS